MRVILEGFTIKGTAKDVLAEIAAMAKADPHKTVLQLAIEGRRN